MFPSFLRRVCFNYLVTGGHPLSGPADGSGVQYFDSTLQIFEYSKNNFLSLMPRWGGKKCQPFSLRLNHTLQAANPKAVKIKISKKTFKLPATARPIVPSRKTIIVISQNIFYLPAKSIRESG
jgi:hypothetical protein